MKKFNTTGVCIPSKHYMVNIDEKLRKIEEYINDGDYFVINRPRQYGKTTTLYMLKQRLKTNYLVISISFEGIGEVAFQSEENFSKSFLRLLSNSIRINNKEIAQFIKDKVNDCYSFQDLSEIITEIIEKSDKEILLFIDEVDKSANNKMFLNFLGMLRSKYLLREQEEDLSFKSVILAGVYDIKNLKLKIRNDEEIKYNSPWNIAINFNVNMSFTPKEIEGMLNKYKEENRIEFNTNEIAQSIFYYTSGYPFLVSRLCEIIHEDLNKNWNLKNVVRAVKLILSEKNTMFDDMIKNIENNKELSEYIFDIVINGSEKVYNIDNPLIDLGCTFGYFINDNCKVKIANRIIEQRMYNYFISKAELGDMAGYNIKSSFIDGSGLNIEKILRRFQQFIKENYSSYDVDFLERQGRLIFLAFIRPIINGIGFDFKEVQISEEKRLDVVITYNNNKYIIELKIWRGENYHKKGLLQLSDYLNINGLDKGYLLVFNFNKNKEYKEEKIIVDSKEIYTVWT